MERHFGLEAWKEFCKEYPYFPVAPHVANSEEVKAYYDDLVASEAKQWGETNYYTEGARKYRKEMLTEYAKGEVVPIAKRTRHYGHGSWGEDVELTLYSDGSFTYSVYM